MWNEKAKSEDGRNTRGAKEYQRIARRSKREIGSHRHGMPATSGGDNGGKATKCDYPNPPCSYAPNPQSQTKP